MDDTLAHSLAGRLLDGRYAVTARIARGGMATVYLAMDTRLDREVALKVMHAELARDDDFVRRFIGEAKSVARLSHQNVVAVYDQGADGPSLYLAMEYVPGRTLKEMLRDSGRLPPAVALEIMTGVLDGLAALDADDLAGDLVPGVAVVQGDGRAASVVEPFVSPGEHARQDREEVAAHFGEQVLVARGIVLVEPLGHDPRVHQLAESVRQRVAGDVQGSLKLVEAR